MIIECPACSKKFNIDEKLIPDEGRLLKCGNCDHTWFYKKEENLKLETETIKINEIDENKSEINIEPIDVPIKQTKKVRKKIDPSVIMKFDNNKKLDGVKRKKLDINLAKKYGWKSKMNFDETLEMTIEDFKRKYS